MTEHLSDQQLARLEALKEAGSIGRTTTGAFGGSKPAEIPELVDLAEYIVAGVHPMDRYSDEKTEEGKAEAWDKGMRTGTSRAMRRMSDEPDLPLASDADNPYRSTS